MVPYLGWAFLPLVSVTSAGGGLWTLDKEGAKESESDTEREKGQAKSEADPRDAPDCSLVPIVSPRSQRISPPNIVQKVQAGKAIADVLPSQRFRELVLVPLDFEDLDRFVG